MKVIWIILLLALSFTSCKKDKVPEPCVSVSMDGDRDILVGKWRWYNSKIEEWFDIGSSVYHNYNPQNQGFNYHLEILSSGIIKHYKNDTLIRTSIMSEVSYENFTSTIVNGVRVELDCTLEEINFSIKNPQTNQDSSSVLEFPFNFVDNANRLRSLENFFVRE